MPWKKVRKKPRKIKAKYEKQLENLRTELRSLKSARKEHAKAMKKNVCTLNCVLCVSLYVTVCTGST